MFAWNSIIRDVLMKAGRNIWTLYILPLFWVGFTSLHITPDHTSVDPPKLSLNFYMMGRDTVDQKLLFSISENVDYLNEEFEGSVFFELNDLFVESGGAYLPTLHENYIKDGGNILQSLIEPIEKPGFVNVFLFDTYIDDYTDQALMGFTPTLRAKHSLYKSKSPKFDKILIAYPGLSTKSTIVHEMGHFLGLQHPWEMNDVNIQFMGLQDKEVLQRNHMTYHEQVDNFTKEQLERMQDFAIRFRGYLLKSSYYPQ